MASLSTLWDAAARAVRNHIRYNAVCEELGAMSERELSDLGIARGDIPFIARQSVADQPQNAAETTQREGHVISFGSSAIRPV